MESSHKNDSRTASYVQFANPGFKQNHLDKIGVEIGALIRVYEDIYQIRLNVA